MNPLESDRATTPPPADAVCLVGAWQMVRAESNGQNAPEMVVEKSTMEFGAGSYCVRFDGCAVDTGTFELGGGGEAWTIVLRSETGQNAGRSLPARWQVRGDRLRICYGLNGIAPNRFAAVAGDECYLATYRRLQSDVGGRPPMPATPVVAGDG